jgi:alkanesulfonate monooxygenase SsuD/methylene tetrahydromethanopterin reductase-like flavin-dependent oxidoreductase (luciferase family)
MAAAARGYRDVKAAVAGAGRDPAHVKVAPAVYVVPGETRSEAEAKLAALEALARPEDALELLSEVLNFDFATKAVDAPFTQPELDAMTGLRAIVDRVVELSGTPNPTVADFIRFSGRGTLREFPIFVGSPREIADEMEAWLAAEACDGFVISATHVPGAYEDFVRLVVPELQRRGLFRRDYAGPTLRENLGVPLPTP